MTIREEPFKNFRSRTSEKWKEKEDKIEEAKKKTKKVDDEWNDAERQPIILVMATANDMGLVFIFILASVELRPNARAF